MNEVSMKLLWCVVQVTIVCTSTSLLALILGRWNRIPIAGTLKASLGLVFLLTVLAMSPWPQWGSLTTNKVVVVEADVVSGELLPPSNQAAEAPVNPSANEGQTRVGTWLQRLQSARIAAVDSLKNASSVASPWVLPLLAFSMLIGSTRLLVGWHEIRQLQRTSMQIVDRRCHEMFCDLKRSLRLVHVDLREHPGLPAPATMGWRCPIVLLPNNWRSWNNDELRSVLAHELAHITRHDFRALAVAQIVALFHFYHPLMHWLVSSLRLEQEMAADAVAARLAGGRKQYMSSLASLALRLDNQAMAWPLRCFLPTSGGLLRRIEMLKSPFPAVRSKSRSIGVTSTLFVLIIGAITAGVRPPAALAQVDEKQEASAADDKDAESARAQSMRNAKSIGLAMHNYDRQHGSLPPAVIVGANGVEHSWRVAILPQLGYTDLYSKYNFNEPWDSPGNKKLLKMVPEVYRAPDAEKESSNTSWLVIVGEGTAFDSDEGHQYKDFTDGTSSTLLAVESDSGIPWSKPQDLEYAEGKPLPKLGGIYKEGFVSVFVDGAAHFITDEVKEDVLRNIILRNDGNVIQYEALHPELPPRRRE